MISRDSIQLQNSNLMLRAATMLAPGELIAQSKLMRQDASCMVGHAFHLCLPNAFVERLERRDARHAVRFTLYPSPKGVVVLCVTLQVGGMQLRTIASCNDPKVRTWLAWLVARGRTQWLLEIEESSQVAWVHYPISIDDPLGLFLHTSRVVELEAFHEAVEVALVAAELGRPESVPTLVAGCPVEDIVLALVTRANSKLGGLE